MKKVLLAATTVSAVPYLVAFLLVTGIAFTAGRIPSRRDKLFLLPWLEFLCGCLTFLVSIGLLHTVGLRGPPCVLMAGAAWLLFYVQRAQPIVDFGRALAGFLAGWGLYRLC